MLQCLHSSYIHVITVVPHILPPSFLTFLSLSSLLASSCTCTCTCTVVAVLQPIHPTPLPFTSHLLFKSPSLSPLHTDCSLKEKENESPFATDNKGLLSRFLIMMAILHLWSKYTRSCERKNRMVPGRFFCRYAHLHLQSTSKSVPLLLLFSLLLSLLLLLLMEKNEQVTTKARSVRPPSVFAHVTQKCEKKNTDRQVPTQHTYTHASYVLHH